MKHLKRILWIVVALMMIAALSAVASAEGELSFDNAIGYEEYATYGFDLSSHLVRTPAEFDPGKLSWTSSDPSIARIYNNGYVYAKKPGEVTISVSGSKGGSASTKLVVKDNPVKAITVTPASVALKKDESIYLQVTLTNTDKDKSPVWYSSDVKWASSDTDVATVYSGNVYATGEGTATITATIKNFDGTEITAEATITVTEPKLTGLKFAKDKYTVKWNTYSKALSLSGTPVNISFSGNSDITFESSNEQIATVSGGSGKYCTVYPLKPGEVTITATYDDDPTVTATTTVVIESTPISKVSLDRTKLTLADTRNTYSNAITFRVEPSNAYFDYKETYWESSDTDIICVDDCDYDSVDLTIGKKYGTATITAYVTDGTTWYTASCEVTVQSKDSGLSLNITKKTLYLYAEENQSDSKGSFQLVASDGAGNEYDGDSYNNSALKIKWSTSKKKVATVNKYGIVKAVGTGTAKITAKGPDGSTATCKVTVKKNLVKKIKGNKQITLRVGDTDNVYYNISTNPKMNTLYDPSFSFTSSNDDVVSVNKNGVLKANGLGAAKITVKAQDGSKKKFTFTVNVIDPLK
jgi:uncharacterized protein YjdB